MTGIKKVFFFWIPPVIWMIFISPVNALLTSQSTSSLFIPFIEWLLPYTTQETVETLHGLLRKTGHFLEYAFLAFLLFRAFRGRKDPFRYAWVIYAGLISLGYSALDEYLQTFIPSRTGSFFDWIIDASGIACVLGIAVFRGKRN